MRQGSHIRPLTDLRLKTHAWSEGTKPADVKAVVKAESTG